MYVIVVVPAFNPVTKPVEEESVQEQVQESVNDEQVTEPVLDSVAVPSTTSTNEINNTIVKKRKYIRKKKI